MGLENFAINLFFAGLGIMAVGYLWVVWRALRVHLAWILSLLPPVWLVFILVQWKKARRPLVMFVLGMAVVGSAYGLEAYAISRSFGPLERLVDGDLHITLTKAKDFNYDMLRHRKQVVSLQMANPDVTDETLQYLEGMDKLKHLDLNDSQVTDAGLKALKTLPALQELKIKGTKVTEAGFKEHLGAVEHLEKIDIRKLNFSPAYIKEWIAGKEGRSAVR